MCDRFTQFAGVEDAVFSPGRPDDVEARRSRIVALEEPLIAGRAIGAAIRFRGGIEIPPVVDVLGRRPCSGAIHERTLAAVADEKIGGEARDVP